MWQRAGQKLFLCGPQKICELLQAEYSPGGRYEFEALTMPKVCGCPWSVAIVSNLADLPPAKEQPVVCSKKASGCRIAFDLGKSDAKTVAVKDGEVLKSQETE